MSIAFEIVGFSMYTFSNHRIRLTGGIITNILAACFLPTFQTILVAISAVIFSGTILVKSRDPLKYLFNISQIGLSAGLAAVLFKSIATGKVYIDIWFVLLASALYIFLNTFFVSIVYMLTFQQTLTNSLSITLKGPSAGALMIVPVILSSYILYYLLDVKAIGLIFIIFLAGQLGNYFRAEYEESRLENLKLLVKSLEMKDSYTRGHSERAATLAYKIAKKLGLAETNCQRIKDACLLHDVGKIGIPDYILNKPDKLTSEEYQIIKTHPVKSEELLETVARFRKKEAKWVRHHHEHWDGFGYPDGLKGEQIPIESRIIAAADIYEALTSDRPYRKAYSKEEALKLIQEVAGTVLDPKVAKVLIEVVIEDPCENEKETK
nr:HD-GYP domain-containing protein [Pseudothermotoga thermarum]